MNIQNIQTKAKSYSYFLVRYCLGIGMMYYGTTKIMHTQFVILPFSIWEAPLESLSGKNVAWAYLGYSKWFESLLGFLEFIPGFLLLTRRTSLLGSILLLPMCTNVMLINFSHNLWPQTQVLSSIFLFLNITIFIFEHEKVSKLFSTIVSSSRNFKRQIIEFSFALCLTISLSIYCYHQLSEYKNDSNQLTGDWINKKPHRWDSVTDSLQKTNRLYFMPFGMYEEDNDSIKEFNVKYYEYNSEKGILLLKLIDNDSLVQRFKVEFSGDSLKLKLLNNNQISTSMIYLKKIINDK